MTTKILRRILAAPFSFIGGAVFILGLSIRYGVDNAISILERASEKAQEYK